MPGNKPEPKEALRELKAFDITWVIAFQLDEKGKPGNWGKSRPIFSIEFRDVSKLVLKGEFKQSRLPGKLAAQSLKFDSRIMKQVSPEAKIKLISETECTVLVGLMRRHFATGQVGE
ncbi:MAG: hypothetical protein ACRERU_08475, partial [Methylococcales bacterium]